MAHPEIAEIVLNRYADVEIQMQHVVQREFHEGPFFVHLAQGRYSPEQIRYFAIQYSYYSRHFPRVLGAAISAMEPIDSWWIPLADNLWDEAGRGAEGKSHEQLYKTFLFSVDPDIRVNPSGIPLEPMSSSVGQAIQTFIEFFRGATPLEAMAAVGLGSELFAGDVMGAIGRGLLHPAYNADHPLRVLFWEAHANEHEPHHYRLCKDILEQYTSAADLRRMFEVGRYIAQSEARMYTGLHHEMEQLSVNQ